MSLSAEQRLFESCATHGGTEAMMLAQEVVDALDASRAQAEALVEALSEIVKRGTLEILILHRRPPWGTGETTYDYRLNDQALVAQAALAAYRKGRG